MKRFIINIFAFLGVFTLIGLLCSIAFIYKYKITSNDIPALNFSDSYSFNEKVLFLNKKPKYANALAIGSSMTLNNLHSKTVIQHLGNDKFINTGSWGMSIIDDFQFLKSLNKVYKIKTLIVSSSLIDFTQREKQIDFNFVESYMHNSKLDLFASLCKNIDLKYYFNNMIYAQKVRNCTYDYEYLTYDNYGAVSFKKERFNIDKRRWDSDHLDKSGLNKQYIYLDSISDFCKTRGIELLFFQSPLREGIYSELSQLKINNLKLHLAKVKYIIEEDNNTFIDANEKLWPDSLFVDALHFNEQGAQLYTEFCFDKIKATRQRKSYK